MQIDLCFSRPCSLCDLVQFCPLKKVSIFTESFSMRSTCPFLGWAHVQQDDIVLCCPHSLGMRASQSTQNIRVFSGESCMVNICNPYLAWSGGKMLVLREHSKNFAPVLRPYTGRSCLIRMWIIRIPVLILSPMEITFRLSAGLIYLPNSICPAQIWFDVSRESRNKCNVESAEVNFAHFVLKLFIQILCRTEHLFRVCKFQEMNFWENMRIQIFVQLCSATEN